MTACWRSSLSAGARWARVRAGLRICGRWGFPGLAALSWPGSHGLGARHPPFDGEVARGFWHGGVVDFCQGFGGF